MSLIDHFDAARSQVHSESFSAQAARRMFRHSTILLVAMLICAFIAGFATPAHRSLAPQASRVTSASDSVFAGRLVNLDPR